VRLEQVLALEPLLLPAEDCATLEAAAVTPAFQLFMQRLSGGAGGERSAEPLLDNARALRGWLAVLKRTAGLPLAIELVASHMRYLPPEQALTLAQGEVLAEGDKHDSLFACFRSSWAGLSAQAQRYLTCLALLEEHFDIEVALELGRAMQLENPQGQLELLLRACMVERIAGAQDHYRVLVPIREFVLQISRSTPPSPAVTLPASDHNDDTNTTNNATNTTKTNHPTPRTAHRATQPNAAQPPTTPSSLYDQTTRLACLWAWHMCQHILALAEKIESYGQAVRLQLRFTWPIFAMIELDAATRYLTVSQIIVTRNFCFGVQRSFNRERAKQSALDTVSLLNTSIPLHLHASAFYNLASAYALDDDAQRTHQALENASQFGVDSDQRVVEYRVQAIIHLARLRARSMADFAKRLKQAQLEAARTRLVTYAQWKLAYAYTLTARCNDPQSAIKQLRHLTRGPFNKGRELMAKGDVALLRIAQFASVPSNDNWQTMRVALGEFSEQRISRLVLANDERVIALSELIAFAHGFQPVCPDYWRHVVSLAKFSSSANGIWVILTAAGIVHFYDGLFEISRSYYEAARRAYSYDPALPGSIIAKALDLLGEKLAKH
ncbi:MAG: hypothetical protein ACRCWJ_21905, partial [Casimicrobium sp.]